MVNRRQQCNAHLIKMGVTGCNNVNESVQIGKSHETLDFTCEPVLRNYFYDC